MKSLCEKGNSDERRVFQKYVDEYAIFYTVSAVWFNLCAYVVPIGTLFISDPFPTPAQYPFAVDSEPIRSIVFFQQAFTGLQCASAICLNIFCALLLLFTAARFEILMNEIRSSKDIASFIRCIKQYYDIQRYAKEVTSTAQYTTLITLSICGLESVFTGIILIGRQPLAVKFQFISVCSTVLMGVFMCALPADILMEASENTMRSVYESKWYDQPVKVQKFVLLMMIPQSPAILQVKCVIPAFSLNYYCS
ncbi:unnamed protein product, partial [Heterotrigona itama]